MYTHTHGCAQGIPPQGVEKIQDTELREFVELCILHDPQRRPEARQLLKHPFFDAVRDPISVRKHLGECVLHHTCGGCSVCWLLKRPSFDSVSSSMGPWVTSGRASIWVSLCVCVCVCAFFVRVSAPCAYKEALVSVCMSARVCVYERVSVYVCKPACV